VASRNDDSEQDEFTPVTEEVRQAFILGSDEDGASIDFDRWLAAHDADVLAAVRRVTPDRETEWRKAIADQVRLNCTPPGEAYDKGGDALIYAVADWIENPPEWSKFVAPVAPVVPDPEKVAREMCRIYCGPDAWEEGESGNPHDPENWHDNSAHRRDAAALLASGVLGQVQP
jgi:hypothetical protein